MSQSDRACGYCARQLVRRPTEQPSVFLRRKFCDAECSSRSQAKGPATRPIGPVPPMPTRPVVGDTVTWLHRGRSGVQEVPAVVQGYDDHLGRVLITAQGNGLVIHADPSHLREPKEVAA